MDLTFPLNFRDISPLLAITAIVLLVTSELLSPYCGKTSLRINKKRLRNAAITTSVLFLATVAMRIATLILNL